MPRELVELADVATNGECFWPPDGAAEAARVLAAQGFLIIGGEVYCRQAVGWAAYLGQWESSPSERDDAPMAERIEAGLRKALQAIEAGPAGWGEPEASPANLRFFFAVSSAPSDGPTPSS